jgi:dipeptidyl aminopeptidase/acylaminoacyl peptidase
MGQSIYASKYFPETRTDLAKYPTGTWLCDTAMVFLQTNFNIFSTGKNYILGLSTGGRGVALVCERKPGLFDAAAALSGDFDQTAMPNDNLSTLIYGSYSKFKDRWKQIDNPGNDAAKINTPFYLGHGKRDKIVPVSQTTNFFNVLKKLHPKLDLVLHIAEKKGHDFGYWRSELPEVWKFFERF